MKYLIVTVLTLAFLLSGCATTSGATRNDGNPLELTEVVAVDGLSSLEIYAEAKIWFLKTFENPNAGIDLNERELRLVVGHGSFPITLSVRDNLGSDYLHSSTVRFQLRFEARDGRYRITFTDLFHSSDSLGMSFRNLTDAEKPGECIPSCDAEAWWVNREWTKLQTKSEATLKNLAVHLHQLERMKAENNDW